MSNLREMYEAQKKAREEKEKEDHKQIKGSGFRWLKGKYNKWQEGQRAKLAERKTYLDAEVQSYKKRKLREARRFGEWRAKQEYKNRRRIRPRDDFGAFSPEIGNMFGGESSESYFKGSQFDMSSSLLPQVKRKRFHRRRPRHLTHKKVVYYY